MAAIASLLADLIGNLKHWEFGWDIEMIMLLILFELSFETLKYIILLGFLIDF